MNQVDANDELLQQYFDGELDPARAGQVEALLGSDPEYAARYDSLVRLRAMFAMSAEDLASEIDFDVLYGRIDQDVRSDRNAPSLLDRLAVWWSELATHRPGTLVAAGAFAALIGVVALREMGPAPNEPVASGSDAPAEQDEPPGKLDTDEAAARYERAHKPEEALARNSEVVQVDFGDNTGTVFEIALAEGVSTPVVWINDEE